MTTRAPRPTHRPRDRKAQIINAAMECFHRSGYDATSMNDIAESVGITAGALYRHFRGKQEILGQSVLSSLQLLADATPESASLDDLLRALAAFSLDHRTQLGVWAGRSHGLSAEHRAVVRELNKRIVATLATALRVTRPDLSEEDAALLGLALLDLFSSPAFHRTELPRSRFENLLCAQAAAVCRIPVIPSPSPAETPSRQPKPGLRPATRRDALLVAALPLFRTRGFQDVSMEEIGEAVGMTGRSVYQYYAGKTEVFAAAMHHVAGTLKYKLLEILRESRSPAEALERILSAYAASAISTGSVETYLANASHLPQADQEALRRAESEYVSEWVALLAACRSDLTEAEARVTVHSALTLVNLLCCSPLLMTRTNPAATLIVLGLRVLGVEH
jgi:AcrR family transcriptional regulator